MTLELYHIKSITRQDSRPGASLYRAERTPGVVAVSGINGRAGRGSVNFTLPASLTQTHPFSPKREGVYCKHMAVSSV